MQYYNMKEIGTRIKTARTIAGLTQEQLALRLQITSQYMSKIERGSKGISIDLSVAIAVELQVSLDFLLLGRDKESDLMKKKIYAMIDYLTEVAESL